MDENITFKVNYYRDSGFDEESIRAATEDMKNGVDIEIVDIIRTWNDDGPDDITPLDVIYEAQGVKDGDHLTFSDDDGDIMVRLTSSDGATGVLTFTENEG